MSPILRELRVSHVLRFCFSVLKFFCDFAQEIIPVLRRKNRALRLTTLNLILTEIRFPIKLDLYYRYLGIDKNTMLVYDCNIFSLVAA